MGVATLRTFDCWRTERVPPCHRSAYPDAVEQRDGVIPIGHVPALLLAALPSLADAWAAATKEHTEPGSPTGRSDYLDAELAVGHLADLLATGDTSEFDAFFDLIESLLTDGDPAVRELAVVGYLETMQMSPATSRGIDPEDFRPWLRPTSLTAWAALNGFWERGAPFPATQHG